MARRTEGDGPLGARAIARIFDRLAELIDPRPELRFADPYQLLVAVVLSAQTTDRAVNAATPTLFAVAPDAAALARLSADAILPHIRSIGLAPTKARHLARMARLLVERHDGRVPEDRAALEALPGVGVKTASVVLNTAFGHPVIAVDTHVHRVANRLGIVATTQVERTARVLARRVPPRHRLHAHQYLILHGRYTCTARSPRCRDCPVDRWCRFPDKTA